MDGIMDKERMICSPLVMSVLSDEELRYLEKNYEFLYSLACGGKTPSTNAQQHFVNVANGQELPETEYEILWYKYSKLLNADKIIDSLNNKNSNLIVELEDTMRQLNKGNNKIIEIRNNLKKEILRLEEEIKSEKIKNDNIGIIFSEQELNEVINVLGDRDIYCIDLAKKLVDKIRSYHMKKNLTKPSSSDNLMKEYEDPWICKACGSNSPYMCRCSD